MTELTNAERSTGLYSDSLEYRRLIADLLMTYKILFELIDLEAADYFTIYTGPTVCGQKCRLHRQLYRSSVRSNFFSAGILGPWNALPVNIVNCHSFNTFRINISQESRSLQFTEFQLYLNYCFKYVYYESCGSCSPRLNIVCMSIRCILHKCVFKISFIINQCY